MKLFHKSFQLIGGPLHERRGTVDSSHPKELYFTMSGIRVPVIMTFEPTIWESWIKNFAPGETNNNLWVYEITHAVFGDGVHFWYAPYSFCCLKQFSETNLTRPPEGAIEIMLNDE